MITHYMTVKSILFLFINQGFSKCEIWRESEYIKVHKKKNMRQHLITSAKIDTLQNIGVPGVDAQKIILMEGSQKINKQNLSLLGKPIAKGSIDEISNHTELWDYTVTGIEIKGFRRKKLIIQIN